MQQLHDCDCSCCTHSRFAPTVGDLPCPMLYSVHLSNATQLDSAHFVPPCVPSCLAAQRPVARPAALWARPPTEADILLKPLQNPKVSGLLKPIMARGSLASTLQRCFQLQQRRWAASFAADGRPETFLFMGPPGERGGSMAAPTAGVAAHCCHAAAAAGQGLTASS